MEEEVVVFHHRARRAALTRLAQLSPNSRATIVPSTLSQRERGQVKEAAQKKKLRFGLALVLRLRRRTVGIDFFEARDAAPDLIVEENRDEAPDPDD
jgi:hypothetical protein